ncbi:MAG: hypothetical protein E7158_01190 [Firmicutes bacterium]|nr:hypothetical protein [Bacillota bacterium]
MDKMKKIWVIWIFLAIVLIGGLTSIGFIYKNKSKKYKLLEKKLVEITKKYTATDFKYPVNNEKILIKYEELKSAGLIEKLEVDNKKCNGYVILSNKDVINYKAYIDCDVYKTHGFDSKNL